MSATPNYFQDIADFHAAMGLPLFGLTGEALVENMKVRKRLVDEELLAEFFPAYAAYSKEPSIDNLVTLIDAICDSIYVVGGTHLAMGGPSDVPFEGVAEYIDHSVSAILHKVSSVYSHYWGDNPRYDSYSIGLCRSLVAYGIKLIGEDKFDACWREVHRTNLAKSAGPVVNGKKMKPPGWVGPDLKSIIEGEKHG